MEPTPHDRGWRYQSSTLVMQWDPARQQMGYLHRTMPSVEARGIPYTWMGWTLASAQEQCHRDNTRLMQAEARAAWQAQQTAAATALDAFMGSCLDTVLARHRETERRRQGQVRRGRKTA